MQKANLKINYFLTFTKKLNHFIMRKPFCYFISIIMISTLIFSCKPSSTINKKKKVEIEKQKEMEQGAKAGPPVIIYKTNADYYDKVPVTLSEDKSDIVSFPGIKDVFYKGKLAYPTRLNKGYLLDNRGIDKNTAFLNITYEEYSKLEKTPSKDELYKMVLDKDPITEMYYCGSKYDYKDIVTELNDIIDEDMLTAMKKLK